MPFKYKRSHKVHTNFVTGVKFSPDMNQFISVGFDKRIVLYESKNGDIVETIAEDKQEGNHTGGIISVAWIDNNSFVTGSLDKFVKIWKIKEKEITTLYSIEDPSKRVESILAAVASSSQYIIALTLDGKMHFWEHSKIADKKTPDQVFDGHQNYISSVLYNSKLQTVYSADNDGKISNNFFKFYQSFLERSKVESHSCLQD